MASQLGAPNVEIDNFWFQQYTESGAHSWHTHVGVNFSNVYFLECSEGFSTQFKNFEVDCKEGDILSFTASTGQMITASVSSISTVDCSQQTEDGDDTNEPDVDGDGTPNYLDADCNDGDVSLTLNILSASAELNYVAYNTSNEPTNSSDGYWDIELQQRKP